MRSRYVLLSLLVILSCNLCIACSSESSIIIEQSTLSVNEFTADITRSAATVTGTARNASWWPVRNYSVVADFYDKQNIKIATIPFSLPDLDSGKDCTFKIELKGRQAWQVSRCTLSIVATK